MDPYPSICSLLTICDQVLQANAVFSCRIDPIFFATLYSKYLYINIDKRERFSLLYEPILKHIIVSLFTQDTLWTYSRTKLI